MATPGVPSPEDNDTGGILNDDGTPVDGTSTTQETVVNGGNTAVSNAIDSVSNLSGNSPSISSFLPSPGDGSVIGSILNFGQFAFDSVAGTNYAAQSIATNDPALGPIYASGDATVLTNAQASEAKSIADEKAQLGGVLNTTQWVLIGVAAVVVVGGLAYLVFTAKRAGVV
jgi:hypothetical protein